MAQNQTNNQISTEVNAECDDAMTTSAETKRAKVKRAKHPNAKECAFIAAKAADVKKATDIVVQYVGKLMIVTDYFVIATGSNDRQVAAIADEVEEKLIEVGMKPIGREGLDERTWILLDYGEFVVHIFQPETREFYRLETLWNDAPIIERMNATAVEGARTNDVRSSENADVDTDDAIG